MHDAEDDGRGKVNCLGVEPRGTRLEQPVDVESPDLETVQEIKYAVRGFSETGSSPADLNEYRTGRHDVFSAVMGMLTHFEERLSTSQNVLIWLHQDSGFDGQNGKDGSTMEI